MKQIFSNIGCGFLILLLAGCATVFQPSAVAPTQKLSWQQRQKQLLAINHWQLRGAFSVQTPKNVNMAHMNWQQDERHYLINISGPLNIGGVQIIGQPGQVTLVASAKQKYTASSPEELLQQALGYRLPISNLYYWVRGVPVPDLPAKTQLDPQQHLIALQQEGWQIQYADYTHVSNTDLPTKVTLVNPELRIRMVINQWQVG